MDKLRRQMTALIDIIKPSPWQMTVGERAALEGILSQLKPSLAIEIGTAEGGSLRRIALHGKHVHSFDLVAPDASIQGLENVTLHTGDSHTLLPEFLDRTASEGQNVDFVLVDGDHTADGVEKDLRDLLESDALQRTVILIHDTLNDEVRQGISRVDYSAISKVVYMDFDCVAGHLSQGGPFHHQLWGGLGLVVVDRSGEALSPNGSRDNRFYDLFELIAPVRDSLVREQETEGAGTNSIPQFHGDEADLRERLDEVNRALHEVTHSASWRLTAPLRAIKSGLGAKRKPRG
jgi:hypothetical protein